MDVVPVAVALDGERFTGSVDTFYARMRNGAVPTTSQPSPAAFLEAYERAAESGAASVLSLHLDARISGVAASAEAAARDASIRVVVADLPTVSYGVAVCVREAHWSLAAGATAKEACGAARRVAAALDNVFVARSAPAGRVSASDTWTVLRFASGKTHPLARPETLAEAGADICRRIVAGNPHGVAVGHAGTEMEEVADRLAHDVLRATVPAVERYRVAPSVGAHTGPDSFGAFWWPAAQPAPTSSSRRSSTR